MFKEAVNIFHYIVTMGEFSKPFQVKPFCAVMAVDESMLAEACEQVSAEWGPPDAVGRIFEVAEYTDYYTTLMPEGILKRFISFKDLQDVERMNAKAKFWTNTLEDRYLNPAGQRLINLDPGYLTLDKFVLYTTKNFNHRLYLQRGLFAEITLSYSRRPGKYEPHHYTYPDYCSPEALVFFQSMRERLSLQLKDHEEQS